MQVRQVTVRRVGGVLPSEAGCAARSWGDREGVCLFVTDGQGNTGVGEAAPLPGHSPETLAACIDWLSSVPVSGHRFEGVEGIQEFTSGVATGAPGSAVFALETALVDLWARHKGQPFWRVLGEGGSHRSIVLNALAGPGEIPRGLPVDGSAVCKVKVGHRDNSIGEEMTHLRALRAHIGPGGEIRLDANGVFSMEEARRRMEAYAEVRPSFIEEPVRGAELLELTAPAFPVAADETLSDGSMRERLLASEACAVCVIKPSLLGGLFAAREFAKRALGAKKGVVFTHMFDGPVALFACAGLAFSLDASPLACGLWPHTGLDVWPTTAPVYPIRGNRWDRWERPGLGFAVDAYAKSEKWIG